MPALKALEAEFARQRSLDGRAVLLHLHLTTETLSLGAALMAGGASVAYYPSNRNPTPPEVVRLAEAQGSVVLQDESQLDDLLNADGRRHRTYLVVEGSGRIFAGVHSAAPRRDFFERVVGISEHTSGGGQIIDTYDPATLRVPVVAVYRDPLKGDLETGLGTSQTTIASLLRGLGRPLAGRSVVVVGYGHVGRGVAQTARTFGARVTVVERRPEARLEAHLKGFPLAALEEAVEHADLCVTATGKLSVLNTPLLERARDGVVLANVSDKPSEIDLTGCRREGAEDGLISFWVTPGGVHLRLMAGGLQINHVFERGNPAELMDISFSLHATVIRWLAENDLSPGLYPVPSSLRELVTDLFLSFSNQP